MRKLQMPAAFARSLRTSASTPRSSLDGGMRLPDDEEVLSPGAGADGAIPNANVDGADVSTTAAMESLSWVAARQNRDAAKLHFARICSILIRL